MLSGAKNIPGRCKRLLHPVQKFAGYSKIAVHARAQVNVRFRSAVEIRAAGRQQLQFVCELPVMCLQFRRMLRMIDLESEQARVLQLN